MKNKEFLFGNFLGCQVLVRNNNNIIIILFVTFALVVVNVIYYEPTNL